MGRLAPALTDLVVLAQQAVEGGDRGDVGALVEELEVDLGRRVVDEALRAQVREDLVDLCS